MKCSKTSKRFSLVYGMFKITCIISEHFPVKNVFQKPTLTVYLQLLSNNYSISESMYICKNRMIFCNRHTGILSLLCLTAAFLTRAFPYFLNLNTVLESWFLWETGSYIDYSWSFPWHQNEWVNPMCPWRAIRPQLVNPQFPQDWSIEAFQG